jgi:hypothetical protein
MRIIDNKNKHLACSVKGKSFFDETFLTFKMRTAKVHIKSLTKDLKSIGVGM